MKDAVKTIKEDRAKYLKLKEEGVNMNPVNNIETGGKVTIRGAQSQKVLAGKYDSLPKLTKYNDPKERLLRKKQASEYMNEVKKKYNLGEIGDNFQKRTQKMSNNQVLAQIEKLEIKARLKEDLARAKGALAYRYNDKKMKKDFMKNPNRDKIMAQLESDLEVEEGIDNMYFEAINAKLGILGYNPNNK